MAKSNKKRSFIKELPGVVFREEFFSKKEQFGPVLRTGDVCRSGNEKANPFYAHRFAPGGEYQVKDVSLETGLPTSNGLAELHNEYIGHHQGFDIDSVSTRHDNTSDIENDTVFLDKECIDSLTSQFAKIDRAGKLRPYNERRANDIDLVGKLDVSDIEESGFTHKFKDKLRIKTRVGDIETESTLSSHNMSTDTNLVSGIYYFDNSDGSWYDLNSENPGEILTTFIPTITPSSPESEGSEFLEDLEIDVDSNRKRYIDFSSPNLLHRRNNGFFCGFVPITKYRTDSTENIKDNFNYGDSGLNIHVENYLQSKYGYWTTTYGFPFDKKYNTKRNSEVYLKNNIFHPFLLNKIKLTFFAKLGVKESNTDLIKNVMRNHPIFFTVFVLNNFGGRKIPEALVDPEYISANYDVIVNAWNDDEDLNIYDSNLDFKYDVQFELGNFIQLNQDLKGIFGIEDDPVVPTTLGEFPYDNFSPSNTDFIGPDGENLLLEYITANKTEEDIEFYGKKSDLQFRVNQPKELVAYGNLTYHKEENKHYTRECSFSFADWKALPENVNLAQTDDELFDLWYTDITTKYKKVEIVLTPRVYPSTEQALGLLPCGLNGLQSSEFEKPEDFDYPLYYENLTREVGFRSGNYDFSSGRQYFHGLEGPYHSERIYTGTLGQIFNPEDERDVKKYINEIDRLTAQKEDLTYLLGKEFRFVENKEIAEVESEIAALKSRKSDLEGEINKVNANYEATKETYNKATEGRDFYKGNVEALRKSKIVFDYKKDSQAASAQAASYGRQIFSKELSKLDVPESFYALNDYDGTSTSLKSFWSRELQNYENNEGTDSLTLDIVDKAIANVDEFSALNLSDEASIDIVKSYYNAIVAEIDESLIAPLLTLKGDLETDIPNDAERSAIVNNLNAVSVDSELTKPNSERFQFEKIDYIKYESLKKIVSNPERYLQYPQEWNLLMLPNVMSAYIDNEMVVFEDENPLADVEETIRHLLYLYARYFIDLNVICKVQSDLYGIEEKFFRFKSEELNEPIVTFSSLYDQSNELYEKSLSKLNSIKNDRDDLNAKYSDTSNDINTKGSELLTLQTEDADRYDQEFSEFTTRQNNLQTSIDGITTRIRDINAAIDSSSDFQTIYLLKRKLLDASNFALLLPWQKKVVLQDNFFEEKDSPYLLMPQDSLVIGISNQNPVDISLKIKGPIEIEYFGDLVSNGKEFNQGLNQNLTSPCVYEAIGTEQVISDQFEVELPQFYDGGYIKDSTRKADKQFQAFTINERYEDSLVPDLSKRFISYDLRNITNFIGTLGLFAPPKKNYGILEIITNFLTEDLFIVLPTGFPIVWMNTKRWRKGFPFQDPSVATVDYDIRKLIPSNATFPLFVSASAATIDWTLGWHPLLNLEALWYGEFLFNFDTKPPVGTSFMKYIFGIGKTKNNQRTMSFKGLFNAGDILGEALSNPKTDADIQEEKTNAFIRDMDFGDTPAIDLLKTSTIYQKILRKFVFDSVRQNYSFDTSISFAENTYKNTYRSGIDLTKLIKFYGLDFDTVASDEAGAGIGMLRWETFGLNIQNIQNNDPNEDPLVTLGKKFLRQLIAKSRIGIRAGFKRTLVENPKSRGYKFGLKNYLPEYSKAIFRKNHYGHYRDLLEGRPTTKFHRQPIQYNWEFVEPLAFTQYKEDIEFKEDDLGYDEMALFSTNLMAINKYAEYAYNNIADPLIADTITLWSDMNALLPYLEDIRDMKNSDMPEPGSAKAANIPYTNFRDFLSNYHVFVVNSAEETNSYFGPDNLSYDELMAKIYQLKDDYELDPEAYDYGSLLKDVLYTLKVSLPNFFFRADFKYANLDDSEQKTSFVTMGFIGYLKSLTNDPELVRKTRMVENMNFDKGFAEQQPFREKYAVDAEYYKYDIITNQYQVQKPTLVDCGNIDYHKRRYVPYFDKQETNKSDAIVKFVLTEGKWIKPETVSTAVTRKSLLEILVGTIQDALGGMVQEQVIGSIIDTVVPDA